MEKECEHEHHYIISHITIEPDGYGAMTASKIAYVVCTICGKVKRQKI